MPSLTLSGRAKMTDKEKIKAELESTRQAAVAKQDISSLASNTSNHHAPSNDFDLSEVHNMEAIRNLLFGKQNAQINQRIKEIEGRFEKLLADHAYRLNELESKKDESQKQKIQELQGRMDKLEGQLLACTKLAKNEIERAGKEQQILLFEQVKKLSEATLKDFEKLRKEIRREVKSVKKNTVDSSHFGEVLMNLGREIQGDRTNERNKSDDKPEGSR